jgi:hypothetical protein
MNQIPVVDPVNPFKGMETWQNTSKGRVQVKRFTGVYGETKAELIPGGRTFHVTPAERRMNSTASATPELDPWTNGTLVLVQGVDGEPDAELVAANPVAMTDDAVRELLDSHHKTFEKRLGDLSNPITLARILEIGTEDGVSIKRIEQIRARLAEVTPGAVRTPARDAPADAPVGAIPEPQEASYLDDLGPTAVSVG